MLFYTHLLLGILFFTFFKDYFSGGNTIIFLGMLLLGSILPDIDESHSTINRCTGIVGKIISFFFEHRGIFHSLLFAFIFFVGITQYWSNYYGWALQLGYCAHLLGDALTKRGVQIFYPFSHFKLKGPLRTGGFLEAIVLVLIVVVLIIRWV